MTTRALAWIAMLLALSVAVPSTARADWDDRPDPSEFQQSLDPNGYWVDDSQFGHVWRPPVAWGWQPYVDGQWIWTSYGWTWSSPEPWAWTFHYGRWGFSNLYGWVWTPGYVWGPAWVNWYWGDGFVGWAPLGPPGFVIVPTYWNYVHDYNFCSSHVSNVFVGYRNLPNYVVHHQDQGWGMRHAPDLHDIERVSRHQIVREADRPRGSIAPWVEHRLERGERVRERIAGRDGDRVIDHPGRGPERGNRGNGGNDAWRRPTDQRSVPRELGGNDGAMIHGGRTLTDDSRRADQERQHRRVDDGNMAPRRPDRDDRVWVRPAPQITPRPAPAPHVMERPAPPSTGYRGGGGATGAAGAPTIVEHGRPGRGGGSGGGPSGGAHPGGPAMQHGAGGAPHGGGGQQHGGGGGAGGSAGGGGGFGGGSGTR